MVFDSTRSVAERYDLGGSDDIVNTIGYSSLEATGTQSGTVIYQEYSNSKATCTDYLMTRRSLRAQFIAALSGSATRHTPELKPEKRGIPFISRRILNSLRYGFSVSVLCATVFGMVSFTVLYFYYQTKLNCQLHPKKSISINCNGL